MLKNNTTHVKIGSLLAFHYTIHAATGQKNEVALEFMAPRKRFSHCGAKTGTGIILPTHYSQVTMELQKIIALRPECSRPNCNSWLNSWTVASLLAVPLFFATAVPTITQFENVMWRKVVYFQFKLAPKLNMLHFQVGLISETNGWSLLSFRSTRGGVPQLWTRGGPPMSHSNRVGLGVPVNGLKAKSPLLC